MTGERHGGLWRRLRRDRNGVVAVLMALVGLPVLIGFAGLGVETGLWYSLKWQSQAAADNAALSAAIELASGKGCPSYSKLAYYAAGYNGFTPTSPASSFDSCTTGTTPNCTNTSDANYICVNSPPTSGAYAGTSGYVEVILSQQQTALLAAVYLPSVTIQSRAVASSAGGTVCVLAKNASANGAIAIGTSSNAASVSMPNCWVGANSTSTTAITATSSSSLCVYDIWLHGNTGVTTTTASDCSAPTAGDITLVGGLAADTGKSTITDPYASGGSHAISYTAPTGLIPFGTQSTTNSATASGIATCSGSPPPAACILHFPNTFDWNTVSGYQVSDLNETSSNGATKISEGTTVYGGCTAPHCGTASKGDVYINNPVQDPGVTCSSSTGGVNGVCKGETISFTTSTSLQPDTLYDASLGAIGLVSGTYNLSPGVYYIVGEDPGTHGHKGVNTQGMALYMGSKATISSTGAVTFIVLGTASNQAGAVDINCSFPFTTGSLSLTAPTTSFTPNLGGSIPAGLLYYQDPAQADTTIVNLSGRAPCQAKGQGHGPPNTIIFNARTTLSDASVIYTPATEFDFSGTRTICTLLVADTITFGLNSNPTSLSYSTVGTSGCNNITPPSAAFTSMAE